MSQFTSITIRSSDDYPLHCRYARAEKPRAIVVLLHGVISHSGWLEEVSDAVVRCGISCVLADRRGAGLNRGARGDAPSSDQLLKDLDAIIEWCKATRLPIHASGFCWGGNYWINYLANRTDICQSLSLFAPSLFPSYVITDQPFEIGDSATPDQVPLIPITCFTDGPAFHDFIEPDPLRLRLVSRRLNGIMAEFSQSLWMKFLRLRVPVLVVLAKQDEVVDNDATARLVQRFDKAPGKLLMLPGKHGIQFDASNEVARHLADWIDEHTNTQTGMEAIKHE